MPRKLTPTTMQTYGEEVAGLRVSGERASEIAPEVQALNRATLEAAADLDLNDEPALYALALARNRQPRGSAK